MSKQAPDPRLQPPDGSPWAAAGALPLGSTGPEAYAQLDEDALEEALLLPAVSASSPSAAAWTFVRSHAWPLLKKEIPIAFGAATLAILSTIVSDACDEVEDPDACLILSAPWHRWLLFASYSVAVGIPGRLLDRLIFSAVSALGSLVTAQWFAQFTFYVSAFEGAVARFWWITLSLANFDGLLGVARSRFVEGILQSLLIYQVLAVAKNILLRLAVRNLMLGSFEKAIDDVLFQTVVVLAVTRRPVVRDGRVVPTRDIAYREVAKMYASVTDFRRKLEFITKLRFRVYAADGTPVPLSAKEDVTPFAKVAFKALARLPSTALVEVESKNKEEIVDSDAMLRGAAGTGSPTDPAASPTTVPATGGSGSSSGGAASGGPAPGAAFDPDDLSTTPFADPDAAGRAVRRTGSGLSQALSSAVSGSAGAAPRYRARTGSSSGVTGPDAAATGTGLLHSASVVLGRAAEAVSHVAGRARAGTLSLAAHGAITASSSSAAGSQPPSAASSSSASAAGPTSARSRALTSWTFVPPSPLASGGSSGGAQEALSPLRRLPVPSAPVARSSSGPSGSGIQAPGMQEPGVPRSQSQPSDVPSHSLPPELAAEAAAVAAARAAARSGGGSDAPPGGNRLSVALTGLPSRLPGVAIAAANTLRLRRGGGGLDASQRNSSATDLVRRNDEFDGGDEGGHDDEEDDGGHTTHPAAAGQPAAGSAAAAVAAEEAIGLSLEEGAPAPAPAPAPARAAPQSPLLSASSAATAAAAPLTWDGVLAELDSSSGGDAEFPARRPAALQPPAATAAAGLGLRSSHSLTSLSTATGATGGSLVSFAPRPGGSRPRRQESVAWRGDEGLVYDGGEAGTGSAEAPRRRSEPHLPSAALSSSQVFAGGMALSGGSVAAHHPASSSSTSELHNLQANLQSIGASLGRMLAGALRHAVVDDDLVKDADADAAAGSGASGGSADVSGAHPAFPATASSAFASSSNSSIGRLMTMAVGVTGSGSGGSIGRGATQRHSSRRPLPWGPDRDAAPAAPAAAAGAALAPSQAPSAAPRFYANSGGGATGGAAAPAAAGAGAGPAPLPPPPLSSGGSVPPAASQPPPLQQQQQQPAPTATTKLRLAHFAAVLDTAVIDVERAFAIFDQNGDGTVERVEFTAALESCFTELRALKASLNGHQSVATAMNFLLTAAFWIVWGAVALYLCELDVIKVYAPLGTIFVSASFAIGNAISNVVSSLIFVLVTRPYNVGDRVTCSGVFGGQETLIVKKVDVLTTTFLRIVNKELTVPNFELMRMSIENFKRSPPAILRVDLRVSNLTTAVQLEALRRRINAYLESQPLAWRNNCIIRATGITEQSLDLAVWVQSHFLWQDGPRLFRAVFAFYMHLLSSMRAEHITFRAADQSLKIEGNLNTKIAPATDAEGGAAPSSLASIAAAAAKALDAAPAPAAAPVPTPVVAPVATSVAASAPAPAPAPSASPSLEQLTALVASQVQLMNAFLTAQQAQRSPASATPSTPSSATTATTA